MSATDWFHASWPAPPNVHSLVTTRHGGISQAAFASLNLSTHVGDHPEHVAQNRAILRQVLPGEPIWLNQVHGPIAITADAPLGSLQDADGITTRQQGVVCAILTADCLPILLTNHAGTVIGACHAGWRGLYAGIIEATVAAMQVHTSELIAWLGPAISPDAFEVGQEVHHAFLTQHSHNDDAFTPIAEGKYLANIYQLARLRLNHLGVSKIYGGDFCTVIDSARFFSYRRDHRTGRMATLIWLEP